MFSSKAVAVFRLFAASIVLVVWSITRFLGVHGDVITGVFLGVLACAVVLSEWQRAKLRREHRAWPN